ncbi:MAG: outer membrane beta-barrel protein [Bacteroidota bacterium]
MKKSLLKTALCLLVITMIISNLSAQKAYLSFNAGYGLNLGSITYNNYVSYQISNTNYTSTNESKGLSLGKGFNICGAFGYMFNKNIGTELGISYLFGASTIFTSNYYYLDGTSTYLNKTYSSNMLRFNPSIIITSGFNKLNPYAKLGLIIGTGSIIIDYEDKEKYTTGNPNPPYNNIVTDTIFFVSNKMNGGLAFGFNASVGVIYKLNDKISLFGEVNMINLCYAPTKGEIVKYTKNGQDILSTLTTHTKETEYVDIYNYDPSITNSTDVPTKSTKFNMPFGSIGINLGIRFNF